MLYLADRDIWGLPMIVIRQNLVPAVLAAALVLASASAVHAQGYQGLFGDDDSAPTAPSRAPDQPQGYQGLIPGAVPQAPAAAPKPTAPTQNAPAAATTARPLRDVAPGVAASAPSIVVGSTPAPAAAIGVVPIRTSDDLRKLAMLYSIDKNMDQIPDQMAAQFRLPATTTELLKQPRPRINGMLPMEQNVKNSIDSAMATIKDPKLRPADRQARAKLAVESLTSMQTGLKVKGQISDRTYQVMGMPPTYVKEEREAITKSLARIDAALKQLQGQ